LHTCITIVTNKDYYYYYYYYCKGLAIGSIKEDVVYFVPLLPGDLFFLDNL